MQNIIILQPENLFSTITQGKKVAIFEVDDQKNPISLISELDSQKNLDFGKNGDIIIPAVKYIQENYNKDIKLDMLADLCDVSKSYLCRLFSARYGIGLNAYIINLRLTRACKLLSETAIPVVNIAFDVGYPDCGYFHKLFKKHIGCTPLEFRKKPNRLIIDD